MKKRSLLIMLMTLAAAMCLLFGACGGKTVKLTFETNGGSEIAAIEETAGADISGKLPADPTRAGYEFAGWYLNADLSGQAQQLPATMPAEDTTYYAKWEQLSAIKLDLAGGSLPEGDTLYLKAGSNLSEFLRDHVPTKAGHEFGAWYVGDEELTPSMTMPAEGVTLTARYKVQFTVEVWVQKLTGEGYERGEDYVGYDYPAENYLPAPQIEGLEQIEHAEADGAKTLTDDPSQNNYKLYFDRKAYTLTYISIHPTTGETQTEEVSALYGAQFSVPDDLFTVQGSVLYGWSGNVTGEAEYVTNFLENHVRNGGGETLEPSVYTVRGDAVLYAVWKQGYRDLFGSPDAIYLPEADSKVLYLCRGGEYFLGEYTASSGNFNFVNVNDKIILEGTLLGNGTFVYRNDDRSEISRSYYKVGEGLNDRKRIMFGAYNEIIFEDSSEGAASVSHGTFTIENGLYIATFTDGALAGETLTIAEGTVRSQSSGISYDAFLIRDEEEYSWGEMHRLVISEGSVLTYPQAYLVTLDGFGYATVRSGSNSSTYMYTREGETLTLVDSNYNVYGVYRHEAMQNGHYYWVYNGTYAHTYNATDGATLTLDGYSTAELKDESGAVVFSGYYSLSGSQFGTLARVVAQGETRLFLLKATERSTFDDEGQETVITEYSFETRPAGYAEYYYNDEDSPSAPMIVLNEESPANGAAGTVTVYGYTSGRTYEKVLSGTYQFDSQTNKYLFTATKYEKYPETVDTSKFDFSKIAAFTFGVDYLTVSSLSGSSTYAVFYVYSVTWKQDGSENRDEDFFKVYHEENGEGTLTLVGAFAILQRADGSTFTGQYSVRGKVTIISPYGQSTVVYVECNDGGDTLTYTELKGLLGTAYGRDVTNGARISTETLVFDGKGGAEYTADTSVEGAEPIYGTVTAQDDPSISGAAVYLFEGGDLSFEFILLTSSSYNLFARKIEGTQDLYQTADTSELLELDGYGFYACYTDEVGNKIEGRYTMPEENVVYFVYPMSEPAYAMYFDLEGDKFTVRGGEYGEYVLVDNNGINGLYLSFDGYTKLSVYRIVEEEGDEDGEHREYVDENGSYTYENGVYHITYRDGAETVSLSGVRGTLTLNGQAYRAFLIEHSEVVYTYVNEEDWSVLIFDAYGSVEKHNGKTGEVEYGNYKLFTENLLYYVNSDGTDACLYRYNKQTGVIQEIRYSARGYFTADLEAMIFNQGGFMIENDETSYFYDVDAQGNVKLYHQDWEDESHNEYGFVETDFGKFEDTKTINGKTYIVNNGYAIVFKRAEGDAGKYPISMRTGTEIEKHAIEQITFTPTGAAEFAVNGIALINGTQFNCTVIRELGEDGNPVLYALLAMQLGSLRVDLTVTYTGDSYEEDNNNVFTVTGMRSEIGLYATSYLLNYLLYYMFTGTAISNTFGFITIIDEYDENGDITENRYIEGEFGVSSRMFDTKGELIKAEKAPYTQLESGMYRVELKGSDDMTYRIYFAIGSSMAYYFGLYSYDLYGFVRVENFESDGYKVELERVIASDVVSAGRTYSVTLTGPDGEIQSTEVYSYRDKVYYFVRTTDKDGKITATTFYLISFTVKEAEGEDDPNPLPLYESATVEKQTVTTYYTADGDYVDVLTEKQEILLIAIGDSVYLAESSSYDAETGVYTVQTSSGDEFTVKIENGIAVVTHVEQESAD